MIAQLTAQAVSGFLEEGLRRMDAAETGPDIPVLVVCPGGSVDRAAFLENWRAGYGRTPLWVRAEKDGTFTADGVLRGEALSGADGAERIVSAVSGGTEHPLTFYLLDGSAMPGEWLDTLSPLREAVRAAGGLELIMILLEEARETRAPEGMPVLLLDGAQSGERRAVCLRTAAAVMVAAGREAFPAEIWEPGIFTAGYARADKPYPAVSGFCVRGLLEELSRREETDLFEDRDALRDRLGITEEGTFAFLDDYVAGPLARYVPAPFQLELFPMPAPETADLTALSARAFNERTFGAWDCWLTDTVKQAQEQVRRDLSDLRRWREEYADLLRTGFTVWELVSLAENAGKLARLLDPPKLPSGELPVIPYVEAWLKYFAASSHEPLKILTEEIRRQGEEARGWIRAWEELVRSGGFPPVSDGEFVRFYGKPLAAYFARNGEALRREFRAVRTSEALLRFLEKAVENLLSDEELRPVLGAAAGAEGMSALAVPEIRLSVPVEERISSVLLCRAGGPHAGSLPAESRIVDTGEGGVSEVLELYRVRRDPSV